MDMSPRSTAAVVIKPFLKNETLDAMRAQLGQSQVARVIDPTRIPTRAIVTVFILILFYAIGAVFLFVRHDRRDFDPQPANAMDIAAFGRRNQTG